MAYFAPPVRPEQFERYRGHLSLPEFGVEGQRRLMEGSVLRVGERIAAMNPDVEVERAHIAGWTLAPFEQLGARSLTVDLEFPRY